MGVSPLLKVIHCAIVPKVSNTVQALVSSASMLLGGSTSSDSSCLNIRCSSLSDAEISNSWLRIWSIFTGYMSVHVDSSMVFSNSDLGPGSCPSASWGIIIGSLMFYGLEDLLGLSVKFM